MGCLAFTRELRQFQWPSHRTFKPDVDEKYTGKTHPSEFLSNYMKEICPRGNNKVLYISLYHDKCLLFMLELY